MQKKFPNAVVEITNPEQLVLLRKVIIPASMGDDETVPPIIGKYRNVLLQYEANNRIYIYSSDGIPTSIDAGIPQEILDRLDALDQGLADESEARQDADTALQSRIVAEETSRQNADATLQGNITTEATTRANADNALQRSITALDSSLAPVAKSGDYDDLVDKPVIGDATITIQKNGANIDSFTANATSNKTINVSVPTSTSELVNDGSDRTSVYVEADELAVVATSGSFVDLLNKPTVDTTLNTASGNSVANSIVSTTLDQNVVVDISLNANTSTTTVQIDGAKKNLYSGATSTKNIALPVASTTQAGVMNASTFDAVTSNTANINALLNGAVAVTGISANPSQADLTSAWQAETGLSTLINRASIYDVSNDKVWTYYTNDTTWHVATNTTQITIGTFTNSSEGTIKGSTNVGQVFAENDGTGSVNGWDTLSNNVSTNTSNITALQTSVAGKQDVLTAGSNITISGGTISATIPTATNNTLGGVKVSDSYGAQMSNNGEIKARVYGSADYATMGNDAFVGKGTMAYALSSKQDTLTAGTNISISGNTISATDTTYTAGTGLTLSGTRFAIDSTVALKTDIPTTFTTNEWNALWA